MMKKTWKKALALVLAFAMTVSSFSGFAAEVQAAETGEVTATVNEDGSVVIGNGYISREFSTAGNKLSTVNITNKRTDNGDTVFTPAEGSEEFIIKMTKEKEPEIPELSKEGWTITADSEETESESSPASNFIDGDLNTFWHTNYGDSSADQDYPHNVVITLNGEKTFSSFSYTPRQGSATNGDIKGYELWASDAEEKLAIDAEGWEKIAEGNFTYDEKNTIYVNLAEECTATQVKFVGTSSNNGARFGGGAEFSLHEQTFEIEEAEEGPVAMDRTGWTATCESYGKNTDSATNDGADGKAQLLLDGTASNWHTNYGQGGGSTAHPYDVYIDMNGSTTFHAFSFHARTSGPNNNGNTKGYELYATTDTTVGENSTWTKISEGDFVYNDDKIAYVNLAEECTATGLKLVAVNAYAGNAYAGGSEFNLYADKIADEITAEEDRDFAASELTLSGTPVVEDTTATINKIEKTGKKITFHFAPYTYRGVDYTISEVIVMYNGDHFMRKYMEISVGEGQEELAEIDYIDLESFKVNETDAQWTIPTDAGGIVEMSQFKANLGQPIYIQGMFFGCEFPETDTEIVDGTGYMRYYTGKNFTRFAADNQLTTDGKYVTWQTVAGAARSTDNQVIQADFYEYIYSIATPSEFRIQYNSWFDNMMLIDDDNILETFIEFDKELNKVETRPLDSYVVDDGWNNYNNTSIVDASRSGTTLNQTGFWEFNSKFPEGLTPSSELVHKFGSNFGVWVGPRGGYNFYGSLADILVKNGTGSKAGGSIDVADRVYLENFTEMACEWQEEYGVNYWKWDGFADNAQYNAFAAADGVASYSKTNHHMTGGYQNMYHVTDLWEGWIDLMEAVRANAEENEIENLWISLTCYTNPSPWFLQWANSVWIQCTADQADAGFGLTKMNKQMTYRDSMYYDFLKNHEFQFPLANIYNHDPVYGTEGTGMNINTATDDDFQNYLYMQSTRGSSFWELYFSDSIMTPGKYEITGEFLEWAEENQNMLRNAKIIGNAPNNTLLGGGSSSTYQAGYTYGFSCFDGTDGILSLRNSSASETKTITFTFDRTIGVAEDAGTLQYHLEHGYLLSEDAATTGTFEYGKEYTFTLEPNEVRIFRISEDGDTTAPNMVRAYTDGDKVVTVKFDEKVTGSTFTVEGATVESVEASADDITFRITLDKALANGASAVVTATDVKDKAGNACTDTITVLHHKDNTVAKGAAEAAASLSGNNGFSVVADVTTTAAGDVVAQGDQYSLAINDDGKVVFTLNGAVAVSDTAVNDGAEHRIAGVKENNGILKVYVDGTLAGAAYNEANRYYEVKQAAITVGDMASMAVVHDVAYGYDEIALYGVYVPDDGEIVLSGDMLKVSSTSEGDAANILDEDATTFWTSQAAADGIEAGDPWLQIDLGQNYMIGQVNYTPRWYNSADNYWQCTGNIEKLVVEVSLNGTDWTTVTPEGGFDLTDKIVKVNDESLFPAEITFDASMARYVRISGAESYHWQTANENKYITVADLKVFRAEAEEFDSTVLADNAMANSEQWPAAYTNDGKAAWAFDDEGHWWHSRYQNWDQKADHEVGSATGDGKPSATNPIWIQTGFDEVVAVDHVTYQARSNSMGIVKKYELAVAKLEDPTATPTDDDFEVVMSGELETTNETQTIQLAAPVNATHVRLTAYSATGGDGHVAAQRIKVYTFDALPEIITHTVTVASSDEAMGTAALVNGPEDGAYVERSKATVKATAAEGYEFVSWTVGDEVKATTETYEFLVEANVDLVANFRKYVPRYTVAVSAEEGEGTAAVVNAADVYEEGTDVTVKATAAEGYEFVAWTEKGSVEVLSIDAEYTFKAAKNVELVANFKAKAVDPEEPVVKAIELTAANLSVNKDAATDDTGMGTIAAIVDGNNKTYWQSAAGTRDGFEMIVALDDVYGLTELTYEGRWADGYDYGCNGNITAFDVYTCSGETEEYVLAAENVDASSGKVEVELSGQAKYVKIVPTATYGSQNRVTFGELALYGTVVAGDDTESSKAIELTETNLSVNKDAATDDTGMGTIASIVDGNNKTYWQSAAGTKDGFELIVTLDDVYDLDKLIYEGRWADGHNYGCNGNITAFNVYTCSDETGEYVLAAENVDASSGIAEVELSGQAKYVKIVPTTTYGSQNRVTFGELALYAYEKEKTYTVTATANDEAMGTVTYTEGVVYEANDIATVTATAAEEHEFLAWKSGDVIVSTNANYSFLVQADTELVAVFRLQVKTEALGNAITAAEEIVTTGYTAETVTALADAIAAAKAAVEAKESQDVVDAALSALETAIAGLRADKTALETAIANAADYAEADYTTDSYAALTAAVATANALKDTENPSVADVAAAAAAIDQAIANLVSKPTNVPTLAAKVEEAEAIVTTGYTTATVTALNNAIAAANTVLANGNATEAQVAEAIDNLAAAVTGLKAKPSEEDVEALMAAVTSAGEYQAKKDDYTEETYTALENAMANAAAVMFADDPSAEAYQAAVEDIEDAIEGLKLKPVVIAKEALADTVETAQTSYNEADYTAESYAALTKAIAEANTLLANEAATKEDFEAAVKAIEDAIKGLKVTEAHTHSYGAWEVRKEATALEAGVEVRKCSCGHEETREIAKLAPTIETNAVKNKIKLQKKQTAKGFKITGLAKGDSIVSIKSSNKKVVKVKKVNKANGTCTLKAGKLTGKKGKATITITLASGLKKTIKVTVQKAKVKTKSITGLEKTMTLNKGKKQTLKPVLVPFTSQDKVKFTSSNKKVVTVTSKGKIKAKKKGKATIKVKAGKKTFKVRVTVK